jgi:hypothetical protein
LSYQPFTQFPALVKDLCKCNFSFSFRIHLYSKRNCYFIRSDEIILHARKINYTVQERNVRLNAYIYAPTNLRCCCLNH